MTGETAAPLDPPQREKWGQSRFSVLRLEVAGVGSTSRPRTTPALSDPSKKPSKWQNGVRVDFPYSSWRRRAHGQDASQCGFQVNLNAKRCRVASHSTRPG